MSIPLDLYIAYVAACALVAAIPGPIVALIVANGLTHGARAGLLNVAGAQGALALMMATLIVGLTSIIASMGWWFEWVRLAGAAYLVWLGWKLLRSTTSAALQRDVGGEPRGGFIAQGFLVMLSNPKALLWFGAFIPQFVDPNGNYAGQIALLGLTAMVVALVSDGTYAILSARARSLISPSRVNAVSRIGGGVLIGGGIWLAMTRR